MIIWKPTACQMDMMMMAGRAVLGLLSQAMFSQAPKVSMSMNELTMPSGWYMKRHRIDTTTIEVTTGMKNTIRKNVVPRSFWLTRTANSSPRPACTGTTTMANRNVLIRDRMKVGSAVKARMKLSRPTKRGGLGEMRRALVKERPNASPTGMTRKRSSSSAAGATMA